MTLKDTISNMPECKDTRICFAKVRSKSKTDPDVRVNRCKILTETYRKDGECPFCKGKIDERVSSLPV